MTEASASGKIILCGEHAVVYGRPAIALPLSDVRAYATVRDGARGGGITFDAPNLQRRWTLRATPDHPFSELVAGTLELLAIDTLPDLAIQLTSAIPIAGGMGSGAALATALVRALAGRLGHALPAESVSALVYASERRFHGTPSGIDNTVVAYERPIWFIRQSPWSVAGSPLQGMSSTWEAIRDDTRQTTDHGPPTTVIEPLVIAEPFTLLIGDTGVRSPTRLPVGEVRRRWLAEPERYEALFDAIAAIVAQVRDALDRGDLPALGALLDANQALLAQLGVSSDELDRLVAAARDAGAAGAKLSGAGWGGVMIALVTPATRRRVARALRAAGAVRVLATTVAPNSPEGMI